METLQVDIINPKAAKLLGDLAELNLIVIRGASKNKAAARLKKAKPVINKESGKKEIYPFKPQYLKFENSNYILGEKLNGIVTFEAGNYSIFNELLDITVWGKTRDEAEEAFAFAFHSLFENFAKEDDKNLTPNARRLKRTLRQLVVNTKK
jgi:hypothetical protein